MVVCIVATEILEDWELVKKAILKSPSPHQSCTSSPETPDRWACGNPEAPLGAIWRRALAG